MKNHISRRDWQRLSAYVDGQLPKNQQARLRQRLSEEPALQLALDDLRLMRSGLRELPKMRAPRNFSLTPEMIGQRKRSARIYTSFRLASVLSSLLFILVMFGDIFTLGYSGQQLSVPVAESVAPAAPIEEKELEEAPESEMAEPSFSAVVEDEAGQISVEKSAEQGLDVVEEAQEDQVDPNVNRQTADDELPIMDGDTEMMTQGEVDSEIPKGDIVSWRIINTIEVVLAGLAFATGLVAFFLRRRGRI